jgi:hypothetical protein
MRREPDGVTCWGRHGHDRGAGYTDAATLGRGRWHRIEFGVRLNPPGTANAEQRLWVDGTLAGVWRGISLRSSEALALNAVQLSASMTGGAPETQSLYVDDITVLRCHPTAPRSSNRLAPPAA